MLEAFGDIWEHESEYDAVVVTTNGAVTKKGLAVMGRGIALQATSLFPNIQADLGHRLSRHGNVVYAFDELGNDYEYHKILTMPVKHHWKERADIDLIKFSALQLQMISVALGLEKILMPRPGCGNGQLKWEDVKPVISPLLDDRFTVMERL